MSINKNKEYNLKEIRDQGLIPWALHYQTLRRIILKDFSGDNILKAELKGEGRLIRYSIRGSRIIKYINNYAEALKHVKTRSRKN